MTLDWPGVWSTVHAERARLIADLDGVPQSGWDTPSLCVGWTVHDVLAHLLDTARTSRIGFARRMITSGFDFDGDNARGVVRNRRADPAATLEDFRAASHLTLTPLAPRATRLVEAFVHGEDIRRPLGVVADYPLDRLAAALRYQAGAPLAMGGGREIVSGLRLVAIDHPMSIGDGDEVRGRTIDLLMATAGRSVGSDAFRGPGGAVLTSRT